MLEVAVIAVVLLYLVACRYRVRRQRAEAVLRALNGSEAAPWYKQSPAQFNYHEYEYASYPDVSRQTARPAAWRGQKGTGVTSW